MLPSHDQDGCGSGNDTFPPCPQATWNMSMLQTQDVMKSAQAAMEKKSLKTVPFSKL